jgi:RHS repeat-associated protein
LETTTFFRDERTLREIRYVHNQGVNQPHGQGRVEYQTVGGTWVTTYVNLTTTTVSGWAYEVGDPVCANKAELINTGITVIDSIVLPPSEPGNTRQFSFDYNSDTSVTANYQWRGHCGANYQTITSMSKGLGSLSQMTMPSGAVVKYSYFMDQTNPSLINGAVNPVDFPGDAVIKKEVLHDGAPPEVWSYAASGQVGLSSVSGPDGSLTIENAYPHDLAYQFTHGGFDGRGGLSYRTKQSDRVMVERKWQLNSLNGMAAGSTGSNQLVPFNPVVDTEFTTLMDPPGTAKWMAAKKYEYDLNGNVTSTTEYDWIDLALVTVQRDAQGVPTAVPFGTPILRVSDTSYYNEAPDQSSANIYHKRINGTPPTPLVLNAPKESTVSNDTTTLSKARFSYDLFAYDTQITKGNLTKESRWIKYGVEAERWIDVLHTYDPATGNRLTTIAPSGTGTTETRFEFGDTAKALPTKVEVCMNAGCTQKQTMLTSYDPSTGLPLTVTDVNNQVTTYDYTNQLTGAKDPFGRPGVVTSPTVATFDPVTGLPGSGQQTVSTRYFDSPVNNRTRVETRSDLKTTGDAKLRSRTSYDQLGRVVLSESSEDGGVTYGISSETVYQYKPGGQNGAVVFSRNAHRASAESTEGWTRSTQDVLGRTTEVASFNGVTMPDATGTTNSSGRGLTLYAGKQTTVTDQAGKVRRSVVDGLGRLIRVDEPNAAGALDSGTPPTPIQPTHYTYDALGNLLTVVQGGQTRTFEYDSLSRLRSAKNPEQVNSSQVQVPTTYVYDDASNILTRTLPNTPVAKTVSFTYDRLNRALTKQLSTGENYTYSYDTSTNGVGRLASVTRDGTGGDGTYYPSYDTHGRITVSQQKTTTASAGQQTYTSSYGYQLSGNKTKEVYPSGKEYRTFYDEAGRISQHSRYHSNNTVEKTYASGFLYAPHGALRQMNLGNGTRQTLAYNPRLQPTMIELRKVSGNDLILRLDYLYGATGQNNGNISQQVIRIGGHPSLVQNYTYDSLNRLSTATETGAWSQTYGYDRFGNRHVSPSQSSGYPLDPDLTPTQAGHISSTTNRVLLPGFSYDFSGNQKTQTRGGMSEVMEYDAENRQTSFQSGSSTTTYTYDGEGRRVKKESPGGVTSVYVYNAMGQMVAEYTTPDPAPPAGGGTSYITSDHLGSARVVTNASGAVKARHDYLPFGEELGLLGGRTLAMGYSQTDGLRQKFTGYERDQESGLDFAQARYCSSVTGRFMSPDPLPGQEAIPQSWNRYTYVLNNPLLFIDPDGLEWRRNDGTGGIKWFNKGDDRAGTTEWAQLHYISGTGENAVEVTLNPNGPQGRIITISSDPFSPLGIGISTNSDDEARGWSTRPAPGNPMRDMIQDNPMAIIGAVGIGRALVAGFTLMGEARAAAGVGSIRNVNPIGGRQNCLNCSIATDATLAGRPASAMPGRAEDFPVLETYFNANFGSRTTISQIESQMLSAGSGARGIVMGERLAGPGATSHVFNVVNQRGVVRFLDGQVGGPANTTHGAYIGFRLLRTN